MGVLFKLCYNSDIYFRYYIAEPNNLTWAQVRDAARVLFGIASDNIRVVYKDCDDELLVSNDSGLHQMLISNRHKKSIKIRIMTIEELNSIDGVPQASIGLNVGSTAASVVHQSGPPSTSGRSNAPTSMPIPGPGSVHSSSHGGGSSNGGSGQASGNMGPNGSQNNPPPATYQMPRPEVPA
ncbi:hypothetical protein H4219_005554 [Mycoemilia scoparia]|uniref:PB1 domain-containing protein n=1 Tax=Mycoemilia scoparia TaxID=417184 RepID=A0A9W7ZSN9_9FUNG|nr:hypothetical protein H4219_005554 [Mycoemilia scoparia]